MSTELERIADLLEREHDGDPWHGSPLTTILDGIDASRAAARPLPRGHSIWEIVLHMTGWKHEVRRRLGGAPAGEPEGGDWPEVGPVSDERWQAARAALGAAHRQLVTEVRALPAEKLFEPTNDPRNAPLGTGVTRYALLHGIVQHDVYHAGQIAVLSR